MELQTLRDRAAAMGVSVDFLDSFAAMERDTLVLQAALWHAVAMANQAKWIAVEIDAGVVIQSLFDLCRKHNVEIPDSIVDAVSNIGK